MQEKGVGSRQGRADSPFREVKEESREMSEFLKKLQSKTPEEKKKITVWVAAVAMFLVMAAWLAFTPGFWKAKPQDSSLLRSAKESFLELMNKYKTSK